MKKIACIYLLFLAIPALGQPLKDVVLVDFVREIQQVKTEDRRTQVIWWIPPSYWEISASHDSRITHMTYLSAGNFAFKNKDELKKDLVLEDTLHKVYYPLEDKDLSDDVKAMGNTLKPVLAQALGQIGKGLELFYFRIKDSEGNNIISESEKGAFTVKEGGKDFKWILPLASLLPPKFCPADHEQMKGNWKFCPIHGISLD